MAERARNGADVGESGEPGAAPHDAGLRTAIVQRPPLPRHLTVHGPCSTRLFRNSAVLAGFGREWPREMLTSAQQGATPLVRAG